jgi:hypothetical protein
VEFSAVLMAQTTQLEQKQMLLPLTMARSLLLTTIVGGVVFGLWLPEHSHKILVSLIFGGCFGLLWRYCWRRMEEQPPEIGQQMRRNAAEAQEILDGIFASKLGVERSVPITAYPLNVEAVLSDTISIVLSVCLAAMAWVLPVFWEPWSADLVALAKSAGAHLFTLCCIAIATVGVVTRLAGKAEG